MTRSELLCVYSPGIETGRIVWIDDMFFDVGHRRFMDRQDLEECSNLIMNNIVRTSEEDDDKWPILKLGAECKRLRVGLYVGHFDALDAMSDDEINTLPDRTLFLVDCHYQNGEEMSLTGRRVYGVELVARKLDWDRHAVRFFSRFGERFDEIADYVRGRLGVEKEVFHGYYSILMTPNSVKGLLDVVRSYFEDARSWFVLPPGRCSWFEHDKAHSQGEEYFDAHCAAVNINFPPSDGWSWKWESAKALLEVRPEGKKSTLSPYAIAALGFFPKLIIDASVNSLPGIKAPSQPAFPFFWSVHKVFALIRQEWAEHGQPKGIQEPSGRTILQRVTEDFDCYFIGMEYEGADLIFDEVSAGEGQVATAVAKAVYGFSDAPDIPEGNAVMLKALRGPGEPVAKPMVHEGFFGFQWPLSPNVKGAVANDYRMPSL